VADAAEYRNVQIAATPMSLRGPSDEILMIFSTARASLRVVSKP
jgi:hypothetical protein